MDNPELTADEAAAVEVTEAPSEDSGEPTTPLGAAEAAPEPDVNADRAAWYAAMSPAQAKAQAEVDAEVALSALYNK